MRFIARVEGTYGVHFVKLAPIGARFEVNTRPRPAVDALLVVILDGLADVNDESLDAWRRRHAPTGELSRSHYRPMALADLMEAANAELFLSVARAASADALAAFALDRGGVVLSEIRAALAAGPTDTARVTSRARRFAEVLGIAYVADLLSELANLHPVEYLMGLEHAVVQWIRTTTEPPSDELAALAKRLPGDLVSAAISKPWFFWWWRLARSCTRSDLATIVERCVELAHRECRYGTKLELATDACAEASRMAARIRDASDGQMWTAPPHGDFDPQKLVRDEHDAHYVGYMALTHAAHAIAAALRADMDPGEANRHAMQLLAELALEILREA